MSVPGDPPAPPRPTGRDGSPSDPGGRWRPGGHSEDEAVEPPPLLGSWRNLYALTLGNLAFLVLVFWLLTRAFS